MKFRYLTIVAGTMATLIASAVFAADDSYETMEEFCNATSADTPENCACGQAKADELLTPDEQRLVIGLMMQDPTAMGQFAQLGDQGQVLMDKVDQITQGCT